MRLWLVAFGLTGAVFAQAPQEVPEPGPAPVPVQVPAKPLKAEVCLLRSEDTFRHQGWRARWEWQGAKVSLEHLGLKVKVLDEKALQTEGCSSSVLVLSNARNLSSETVAEIREYLKAGGGLLASYQSSYKQSDNSSWQPNDLALGPELGVKFTRWNGSVGETEVLQVAPPYGEIPLARHQAMLVDALPGSSVLGIWTKPYDAAAIVQNQRAIYVGEDLLSPENSHSLKIMGLMAGLLNSLDPNLRLSLPKTAPRLVEPNPPFTPLLPQPQEKVVRVGLGTLVGPKGSLTLSAPKGLRDNKNQPLGRSLRIEVARDQLWLVQGKQRKAVGKSYGLRGAPYVSCWQENPNGTARWQAWRGGLTLHLSESGIRAVNELPGDSYLAGVIPSEVPFTFPAEALKAMAVVARTYSLSHLGRHAQEGFDVCSEVHCQVYRGLGQEHPNTNKAIAETRGELLNYGNRPADATFHACCGGHGVDVQSTWSNSAAIPYLRGAYDQLPASAVADLRQEQAFRSWLDSRAAAYCSGAGRFRWEESYSWADFEKKLKQSVPVLVPGQTLERLDGLQVLRRDPSGRVQELLIQGAPAEIRVGGDSVRWLTSAGRIGSGGLQSSMWYLDVTGTLEDRRIRIVGGGWGHGVGLCQEGASGRARNGHNYRQILAHYYPGTQLIAPENEPLPTPVKLKP